MATVDSSVDVRTAESKTSPQVHDYAPGGVRFDVIMVLLCTWFVGGAYLDSWAHNNIVDGVESFFTLWHAVLYSGFAAVAGFTVYTLYRNVSNGYAFHHALPRGYGLALLGVIIFSAAGGADFVWHELFGFEENIEALLSPSHLLLVLGGVLLTTGPLRAAWHRPNAQTDQNWRGLFPAVMSVLLMYSLVTFIMQFSSIVTNPSVIAGNIRSGEPDFNRSVIGINDMLIQSAILTGIVLVMLRRWQLPTGAITFIVTVNTAAMYLMDLEDSTGFPAIIIGALIAGLIADALRYQFRPSVERINWLRILAFVLPFFLTLFYIQAIAYHDGVIWRIHMTLGVPIMAGFIGLGLSYVLVPPAVPAE